MNKFIENVTLEEMVNKKLNSLKFNDCIPNGLQIEGTRQVSKIITGVTACQTLLDVAVKKKLKP